MSLSPSGAHGRWPARLALLFIVGGVVGFAMILAGSGSKSTRDDSHAIVDVISGGDGGRTAVVDRYARAADGVTMVGVWVVQGAAPERGSTKAPEGQPVAVWRDGFPRLAWQAAQLRVIGNFDRIRKDDVAVCLADRAPAWDLCIDPARVTFVPLPR